MGRNIVGDRVAGNRHDRSSDEHEESATGGLPAAAPGAPHEAFLRLRVGPSTLLARVTRDAVAGLGLAPGMALWALVKAVAFDHAAADAGGTEPPVAPSAGTPAGMAAAHPGC